MHSAKKVEIIANSFELGKILECLDKSGVNGYTVMRNVAGKGLFSGPQDLDFTMLDGIYIMAFCLPDQVKDVVGNVRPLLNKFGGACYISDVMEVRSIKCVASL